MRGGKAFTKPLPFLLGTNSNWVGYGSNSADNAFAQAMGMKVWRCIVPWNWTDNTTAGVEEVVGTFNSTTATTIATVAAGIKALGMKPLFCIAVNNTPGLSSTWSSGIPCTPAQFSAAVAGH
jgi:hypothetical protein